MNKENSYVRVYLKNMLLTALAAVLLLLLAYFSVHSGKNAILDRQQLCMEQWNAIHDLSATKLHLLEKLQEPGLPVLPEEMINGVPNTRPLARFLENCDSLALKMTGNENRTADYRILQEYINHSHEMKAAVSQYNDLVRESNHFMKEFPNNFYSSLFSIPSLPDFRENDNYLSNIELYLLQY
ncbi:MAG TPA: hypothetical protein ENN63_09395 [Bacteroidetes bacterium]|mgnify:CR=1 FL=1|nr:hypothetical protein [Bacteroidota bacterium]